jgi:hypothetical protein
VRYTLTLRLLRHLVLLPSYTLVLLIRAIKWLIAPLALILQLVIGIPLTLRQFRQPLQPDFAPVAEPDLPSLAWIALTDATEALTAEGFTAYGDFRCDNLIHGGRLWLRLLGQSTLGIAAIAAHIELKTGARPLRQFIEFATEFTDGRVLVTNNLDLAYSLPPPSYLARIQLKDIWDARALFALHYGLVQALGRDINKDKLEQAKQHPATLLTASYAREIKALAAQGWLTLEDRTHQARLRPLAAVMGVWRQAWPLASLYLRAANRRSRRLLAAHGLEAEEFAGAGTMIIVSRQTPTLPMVLSGVIAGYQQIIESLARDTDPKAALEVVTVELEQDAAHNPPAAREFRYSFRSYDDQAERRIRRLRSFDILLNPATGASAVTAMEREFEQVDDENAWAELTAIAPFAPLRLNSWLYDLDQVLPTAQTALAAEAGLQDAILNSASLYIDDGALRWQIVAWTAGNKPLAITLDARSGAILHD